MYIKCAPPPPPQVSTITGINFAPSRTYVWIKPCLPLSGQSQGPPFTLRSCCLSREMLVRWLRTTLSLAGVDASHFSGHSFRIGAGSTAAANGVAEMMIQTFGRWESDSYTCKGVPREELAAISRKWLL